MDLQEYIPFWKQLRPEQQQRLLDSAILRELPPGAVVHSGSEDCVGLLIIISGQLRAFTLSDEGREITLYRLLDRDFCLFSASCMLRSIQFDIIITAERATQAIQIPVAVYQALMEESAAVANYTSEVMAARFSDVMWLLDQVLYKRLDSRLAAFLLEESELEGSSRLYLTHDVIARHLGSAREVVTRMLKYFQQEGLVTLFRGGVSLDDPSRLTAMAQSSLR